VSIRRKVEKACKYREKGKMEVGKHDEFCEKVSPDSHHSRGPHGSDNILCAREIADKADTAFRHRGDHCHNSAHIGKPLVLGSKIQDEMVKLACFRAGMLLQARDSLNQSAYKGRRRISREDER